MKAILKPTQEIINVSYDKESNLYYDMNKPYLKYISNDIELVYSETPHSKDIMIYGILSNFNFEKVRKYMELVKWRYWDTEGAPTIDKLKDTAKNLLNDVYGAKDYMSSSTGGFKAEYSPEMEHGNLKLSFVIEEYEISKDTI